MSYNNESEIRKWKKMKESEEKILAEYGMSQEAIKELREYDWNIFKSERIYKTRQCVDSDLVENAATTMELPINSFEDILAQLDNKKLYDTMKDIDYHVIANIILLRTYGYYYKEIANQLGISVNTVKYHLKRIRKKAKK